MRFPTRRRVAFYGAAAVLAAALSFVPTPYALIMPGSAVDLRGVVTVLGHTWPSQHFYLTDVTLQTRTTPIMLLAVLLPGTRVLRADEVLSRDETPPQFEGRMRKAMDESQAIAAFVAERAAHLHVPTPKSHVIVYEVLPMSHAHGILEQGDVIRTVAGKAVRSTFDITNVLFKQKPGAIVHVIYTRERVTHAADFPTIALKGKTRLGILLLPEFEPPKLPIPVRYRPFNVSGSSGGLMFALAIYRTLHNEPPLSIDRIAGTGTISYDGTVGPIEGATQKLIAARRAQAQLFFVPRENYAEIARARGITIVAVHSFNDALRALDVEASDRHPKPTRSVSMPRNLGKERLQ
ncbi:MAG: hypothetical protein JO024_02155 [Candidatus Eremiobacteraeota bacterium]|nr:hypothetical protein [Candidatus Eremiobacteraeota bacterium]